jgi:hypothetical protein
VLLPGREFDFARWTRRRAFVDLHATVVAWLDGHFEAIELGAPWLRRVGTDVSDYCEGEIRSRFGFSLTPRFRARVGCQRSVIVVYGFDGDLTGRLDRLAETLLTVGWKRSGPLPLKAWADAEGYASLDWRPNAALSRPRGMNGIPPSAAASLSPHMWMSWSSRGQATRLRRDPARTRSNTLNYLAVESSGTEYWKFPGMALEENDHTVAVKINLGYYNDTAALTRPHRVPRYLLPARRDR